MIRLKREGNASISWPSNFIYKRNESSPNMFGVEDVYRVHRKFTDNIQNIASVSERGTMSQSPASHVSQDNVVAVSQSSPINLRSIPNR